MFPSLHFPNVYILLFKNLDYEIANQEDDFKEETYSSEEEFDSSKYGLSEYELLRKENMEKNLEMFQQFNVVEVRTDFILMFCYGLLTDLEASLEKEEAVWFKYA